MPTYDYECGACEHAWELFQPMSAKPVRKCPECGKLKAERLIGTGGGILFKGSGFYETDYRSASYKKGAKAEKKATEKKAESKKTEPKKSDSSGSTKSDK
jgi:putative FmdB family regulatory protein